MNVRETTWAEVRLDSEIVDGNGEVWRVAAVDDRDPEPGLTPWFRMVNSAEVWVTVKPKPTTTPVRLVEPEYEEGPEVALLRDVLGAVPIATKDHASERIACAPWDALRRMAVPLDDFRTHLVHGHGMYATDIKTYAKLVEAHEAAHDPARPIGKDGFGHHH